MITKADLRADARRRRAETAVDHGALRGAVARHLALRRSTRPNGVAVLFAPLPGEPQLLELVGAEGLGRFALTRTPGDPEVPLTVHELPCALETHRYGFAQPTAATPEIDDAEIDVVCVPGLVFDLHGGRLGFGAGYYDRFLARLGRDVQFVGIGAGLLAERIPVEPHDVAMTHLATEGGVVPVLLAAD